MPSRYYKILLPVFVFGAAAALCVGVGYKTLHEQAPPTTATPTIIVTASTPASTSSSVPPVLSRTSTKTASAKIAPKSVIPAGYIQSTISVSGSEYAVAIPPKSTVEGAMKLAAAQNPAFTFTEKSFPSLGEFIESINGKTNANGYYWFLYINGKSSNTGISETIVQPGDAIQWQYKHQ
jgi:hypothetical protein